MLERLGPAQARGIHAAQIGLLPAEASPRRLAARPPHAGSWLIRAVAKIGESCIAASEPAPAKPKPANGTPDTCSEGVLDPKKIVAGEIDARKGVVVVGAVGRSPPLRSPSWCPAGVRSTGGAGLCQPSACRRGPCRSGRQDHKNLCLSAATLDPLRARTRRRLVRYRRP